MLINKLIEASAALWTAYLNWSAALIKVGSIPGNLIAPKDSLNFMFIGPIWGVLAVAFIVWGAVYVANNPNNCGAIAPCMLGAVVVTLVAPMVIGLLGVVLASLIVATPWLVTSWLLFKAVYWFAKRHSGC